MNEAFGLNAVFPTIAVVSLLFAIWQVRRNRHETFCRETQRLDWATDAVRDHGRALDRFMYIPGAPEDLKNFLVDASDALESRDFARLIARKLNTGLTLEPSIENDLDASGNEVWSQVMRLASSNVEAYDAFVQALFAGIAASLLRWPETAPVLSRPLAPTLNNVRREVLTTARAVHETTSRSWPNGMIAA